MQTTVVHVHVRITVWTCMYNMLYAYCYFLIASIFAWTRGLAHRAKLDGESCLRGSFLNFCECQGTVQAIPILSASSLCHPYIYSFTCPSSFSGQ